MEISPSSTSPDFEAYLLQRSLISKDLFAGKSIHARIIKCGLHFSVFLMNNLMNLYSKTGSPFGAHQIFDEMPVKTVFSWNTILSAYTKQGKMDTARVILGRIPYRDSVSWTTMINGYNQMGRFEEGISIFGELIKSRIAPTDFTFTSVLASCAAIEALEIGKRIHSMIVQLGFSNYVSVANSLLNMYVKSGEHVIARVVFDRMIMKNTSSWNVMIWLHMQAGQINLARDLFEKMSDRDIVTWNSVITGYNQHGDDLEALYIFSRMLMDPSLSPDKFTLASVLSACANIENLKLGKEIHAHIIRTEFSTDGAVGNALVSMYTKSGGLETARRYIEQSGTSHLNYIAFTALLDGYIKLGDTRPARQIFDSLKDRDVVAWTAMIVGYEQNALYNEALNLFRSMINEKSKPNSYTLAAVLSVTSSLGSLGHGKQIHASAIRSGDVLSTSVTNALITMYAKAGSIKGAKRVFDSLQLKNDTVSWTSMIIALAQHGFGEESLKLFDNMLMARIKPDHITYVGVLSACTHVGLVEKGRRYYTMMKDVHKIEPTQSHYACMIDLLGRAGLLVEAHDFIKEMPVEPDAVAWGSLLASCTIQKNVELGKTAAERLLLIDPDNSGAYSALANLYSASGKWEAAAKIRKSMKDGGVKKEQGVSWLEVKHKVHTFGVEDGLHPRKDEIYKMMEKIWNEIKKMGFVPNTDSVLHDLEEEVKEQILRHHSEKLAIAFGLISTPENTTLRIMKNLRVCNDCHTAIKYISKLMGREIVVRDVTRFHHFKDGLCSCRDFW